MKSDVKRALGTGNVDAAPRLDTGAAVA